MVEFSFDLFPETRRFERIKEYAAFGWETNPETQVSYFGLMWANSCFRAD